LGKLVWSILKYHHSAGRSLKEPQEDYNYFQGSKEDKTGFDQIEKAACKKSAG